MPLLYIFWLLHQTTTPSSAISLQICCISFDSYIKPQLNNNTTYCWVGCISFDSYIKPQLPRKGCLGTLCCISFDSYIKPQLPRSRQESVKVVYLLTPTSNHNIIPHFLSCIVLYIFWLLHQTTTTERIVFKNILLYIFWLLHQTTTFLVGLSMVIKLYIFWLLHQTTTLRLQSVYVFRCISFDSYIKPQPIDLKTLISSA